MAATTLYPELGLRNDNSGQVVSVINADTKANSRINNGKIVGLQSLGNSIFSGYPLKVGTDLPAKNESNYVANDNSGSLIGVLNADTSSAKLNNGKLAGPLLTAVEAGAGISVTSAPSSGLGTQTIALTGGKGSSPIIADLAVETELTTTSATQVATYTPAGNEALMIYLYLRAAAAASVSASVTYDNAAGTAQTNDIVPSTGVALTAGDDYPVMGFPVVAGNAAAVDVSVTASAANAVYASSWILKMAA